MKNFLAKRIAHVSSLCAAAAALAFTTPESQALDVSGLISVNGAPTTNVLVGVYNCVDGIFFGAVRTGPMELVNGIPRNYSFVAPADDVRIELYYTTIADQPLDQQCREFVHCGEVINNNGTAIVNFNMTCAEPVAVAGPGFWRNHPRQWPVERITIGGRTLTKLQAIILMSLPQLGDKTKLAFRQLVAAKLNVLAGAEDSCIAEAIAAADAWLARNPVCSGVRASSPAWKRIAAVITRLDAYNSGLLCAPHRDGDEDPRDRE